MFGIGESKTDAVEILKSDHDSVDEMFKTYEAQQDDARPAARKALATQICDALTTHAAIEEEIFYPAVRKLSEETGDLVAEAAVEHQTLKDIIARLQAAPATDPLFDAGVKVLSEYVKHHVKEEESELFPKVRASGIDLETLGERMLDRKSQLESQPHGRRSSGATRRGPRQTQPAV